MWGDGYDQAWIEACLTKAAAEGCNVVRTIGSVYVVTSGALTRAAYLARWTHFIDYAESLGMYVLPTACDGVGYDPFGAESGGAGPLTQADLLAEVVAFAEHVAATRRCIGIDLINEVTTAYTDHAYGLALYEAVKAVTDVPLTYSLSNNRSHLETTTSRATIAAYRDRQDFVSIHWYSTAPTETVAETYYWDEAAYWPLGDTKPILVGEFGIQFNGSNSAAQVTWYNAMKAMVAYIGDSGHHIAGAMVWNVQDQETNQNSQYGLFDNEGDRRAWIADVFNTFPTSY